MDLNQYQRLVVDHRLEAADDEARQAETFTTLAKFE